jgi:hypothetical protein
MIPRQAKIVAGESQRMRDALGNSSAGFIAPSNEARRADLRIHRRGLRTRVSAVLKNTHASA